MTDENNWITNEFRQKIRDQLEKRGGNVIELENLAFENSKTQKEYISFLTTKMNDPSCKPRNDKLIQSQQRHPQLIAQRGTFMSTPASSAFIDGTTSSLHANGSQSSNLIHHQLLQQQQQQQQQQMQRVQQPDPINALQHLTKQGVPGQQPGQVIRQPNQMSSVIQQRMQFQGYSGPGGPRNVAQPVRGDMIMMQSPSRVQMMTQQGQIMQPGQFVGNNIQTQFQLSAQPRQMQTFNQIAGSPGNLQGLGGSQQQHLQQMQPSPALGGSSMMIPSPSNLNIPAQSPAMQQHLIGLSPSSRMSLSSPGSHLGTPGNPGSVPIGGGPMSSQEEQEYLQKWEHLQKYLEPLKKMINKIDKEEDKKMDLNKMKNLLDILSNPNKRVTLNALIRCEAVLEKQLQVTSDTMTSSATTSSGTGDNLIFGQDLLDALISIKDKPNFFDITKRAFGFVKNVVYFPHIEEPDVEIIQPPGDDNERSEVEDFVQCEVARLNKRFVINISDSHFTGSDDAVLTCNLDDDRLPAIPPIEIHLPKGYPMTIPTVHMDEEVFGSSEFLKKIRDAFQYEMDRMICSASITTILGLWELSVRKSLPRA